MSKKRESPAEPDEMREEYDFSKLKRVGRGVFFEKYWRAQGGRLLDPELASRFADDDSVNKALHEYLKMKQENV